MARTGKGVSRSQRTKLGLRGQMELYAWDMFMAAALSRSTVHRASVAAGLADAAILERRMRAEQSPCGLEIYPTAPKKNPRCSKHLEHAGYCAKETKRARRR